MISLHISFPRKEMVYHFTVYPAGIKVSALPTKIMLPQHQKPDTKLKLSKHSTVVKGHLYFKNLVYVVHC